MLGLAYHHRGTPGALAQVQDKWDAQCSAVYCHAEKKTSEVHLFNQTMICQKFGRTFVLNGLSIFALFF